MVSVRMIAVMLEQMLRDCDIFAGPGMAALSANEFVGLESQVNLR